LLACISKHFEVLETDLDGRRGRSMGIGIAVRYGRLDIYWRWLISQREREEREGEREGGDHKTNLPKYWTVHLNGSLSFSLKMCVCVCCTSSQ
jgi:hypothetical protein